MGFDRQFQNADAAICPDRRARSALTVSIPIPDPSFRKAKYGFDILSHIWGIPLRVHHGEVPGPPDILYGARKPPGSSSNTLFIPFREEMYAPRTPCESLPVDGWDIWAGRSQGLPEIDFVGGLFRLITLMDESQVGNENRDRKGIFYTEALPQSRQKTLHIPLVENHAAFLLSRLLRLHPWIEERSVPRWPQGKKYVISLTHDNDAVNPSAMREILTNLVKTVFRRDKTHLDMLKAGLGLRRPNGSFRNPLYGFPVWKEFESAHNIRSCFYLFLIPPKTKRDINDCKSDVTDGGVNWSELKAMAEEGWEFGLHASIHAKHSLDPFLASKKYLEEKLERPLRGLRHHYWALDWKEPHRTFRKHVNAGFRYDTSMAWRNATGFRPAISLPYQPFDPVWNKPLAIYELPTCLMDGHIVHKNRDLNAAIDAGRNLIQQVKKRGGMAVLDWHAESSCNIYTYKDYFTVLQGILLPFFDDKEAWFATPHEITRHWHCRRLALETEASRA